jgi:hypothetical protein
MENEIWKDIEGYEGVYQVSNLGRVKSLKFGKEKIFKTHFNQKGYCLVTFTISIGKSDCFTIHRLVATAFLGKSDLHVNHINGNKQDNRVENLEYVSNRENNTHKFIDKKTTSKYTGVCWLKNKNKWLSNIYLNKKKKHLGLFDTELDAHNAYLKALEENNIQNKYAISTVIN